MTVQTDSERNPRGFQTDAVPDSALSQPASQVSRSPLDGTRVSTRDTRSIREAVRQITYADALTSVVRHLRPDWDPAAIRREVLRDPRPDAIAAPAAIFAACDLTVRGPGAIGTYRPPTHREEHTPEIRAPRCPHGTLADPDGRGTNCHGCGTTASPPSPDVLAQLRAAATGPTRHTPEPEES